MKFHTCQLMSFPFVQFRLDDVSECMDVMCSSDVAV